MFMLPALVKNNFRRGAPTGTPPLQLTPRLGGYGPSIVVHHERANATGPGQPSTAPDPATRIDSTTMTDPGPVAPAQPTLDPSRTWSAPQTQHSFDKSAQVRPCSSQVLDTEEVALPPVLEELTDKVFAPQPAPQSNGAMSATATAPWSTTATAPSTTVTAAETDSGAEDRQGLKCPVSTSNTSYSQAHRTLVTGPSNYPKRPSQPHPLPVSQAEDSKGGRFFRHLLFARTPDQ